MRHLCTVFVHCIHNSFGIWAQFHGDKHTILFRDFRYFKDIGRGKHSKGRAYLGGKCVKNKQREKQKSCSHDNDCNKCQHKIFEDSKIWFYG